MPCQEYHQIKDILTLDKHFVYRWTWIFNLAFGKFIAAVTDDLKTVDLNLNSFSLCLYLSLSFCFDTVCSLLSHYGGLITRWNLIRLNIVAHTTHSKHDFIFYAISSSWYCFIITIYVDFISSFRMICVHSSAAEAPTKFISMEFVYSFFSLNGIPKFFVQKCHSQNDHLRITPATFDDRLSIQYDIIRIAVP